VIQRFLPDLDENQQQGAFSSRFRLLVSSHVNVSVTLRCLQRSRPRSNSWLKQNQRRLFLTTLHHYIPHLPLSIFVEGFWLYQGTIPPHTKERRLPDGSTSLVINLRDDLIRLYDQRHPDQFQSHHGMILCGARSEFALREQLQTIDTPGGRFQILEQFLLARLARSRTIHPVVTFALKAFEDGPSPPTISSVTGQIGLSQTRFIQLFREAVGLTPKQFCRILRFQHVLCSVEKSTPHTWTDLALTCGYYDQAHFIHDFQAFSGLTPGAYLAQRSHHRNHVPFS
jgi:AraC-like DNA-binding protein